MIFFSLYRKIFRTSLCLLFLGLFYSIVAEADEPDVQAAVREGIRRGAANFRNGINSSATPTALIPLNEEAEAIRAWAKEAIENLSRTNSSAPSSTTASPTPSAKIPLGGAIHWREDGTPRKILFEKVSPMKGSSALNASGATPKDHVLAFLEKNRELFRLAKPAVELALIREERDDLGFQHWACFDKTDKEKGWIG